MASKINYNNKAPFQTLEEIPDENKVNAADMNEIKTVVNNNADELDTAKENIENLESGQGTSNTEITNLKNRVSTLETDNSTNKTNISNLEENKVDKVKGKGLSTEDFTTELKSKLESLENYDDTEIKEDISNLESEQTEQDKQIDMLINALPSETSEAENINIKGTIPVKFKDFKLSGNSKQETSETMPSPEYPSEIQNVEGDVNVTVANKNLFTGLVKGISINSMGELVERDTSSVSNFIKVDFDKNSRYYLSGLTNTLNSYVSFYNKDKQYLGRTAGDPHAFISFGANSFSTKVENYEDIEDKNIKFIKVSQYEIDTSTGTIDDIDNLQIQLEPGTTATNYVEHQEQLITFPLAQGQKLMLGDYLADDGIHHVRKQIELDGTENWQLRYKNETNSSFSCNLAKGYPIKADIQALCSNYKYFGTINSVSAMAYIEELGFALYYNKDSPSNTPLYINSSETTLEAFKSYLAQQKQAGTPVIVEYELAEEEIEAYTPEQQEAYNQLKQLTAYEEETNVYSKNEVSPIFKVTAVKDINSVITQLNTVLLERS